MNLLITAATWDEIKPLEDFLQKQDEGGKLKEHTIDICITGVGGVQTAFQLGKKIQAGNWHLTIQLGICGSFRKKFPVGTTVNVVEESFADLGAEDNKLFIDVFEMGLLDPDKFPFKDGRLFNKTTNTSKVVKALPSVKGISVNKVHGNKKSIKKIISKYNPDVESMEGTAFFYCCIMESIPFLQLRTVSNLVKKRDKDKWDIPLAIKNLNKAAIDLITELLYK